MLIKYMKNVIVADVMTRKPITTSPDANLLKCAQLMIKKKTGTLLLAQKSRLVGIISRRDILWALVKKSKNELSEIKAIDISPRKIATIKPNRSLEHAKKKMKKVKLRRLPVIHKGELVGMITMKDIMQFNPDIFPEMQECMQIKDWEDKVKRIKRAQNRAITEGVCNECGHQGLLVEVNGEMVCEDCADLL